jgi:hypothetical protein
MIGKRIDQRPKPDFIYWNANNPLELARDTSRFQGMKIYFDCGTEDNFGFYAGHKVLDDVLTKSELFPHCQPLCRPPRMELRQTAHATVSTVPLECIRWKVTGR